MSDTIPHQEEGEFLEPVRTVTLTGEMSDPLPCEVIFEVEDEGTTYALLTPAEPVVMLLREDATSDDAPLESLDTDSFPSIKKHILAALAPFDLNIKVKGDEFVLVGEMSEEMYDQSDLMEVEDEDDEGSEYLIIAEVDDAAYRYLVALPMEPPLYAGCIVSDEEARRLSDDEFSQVEGLFSEVLLSWAQDQDETED